MITKQEKMKMIFKNTIEIIFYISCVLMLIFTFINAMQESNFYNWLMFVLVLIMVIHQIKDDITLKLCDKEKDKWYNEVGKRQSKSKIYKVEAPRRYKN